MIIEIENCNNVSKGKISIIQNKLNIKYAINGIGKSTIAKAILLSSDDRTKETNTINQLKPFKSLHEDTVKPSVKGIDTLKSVLVFDETYINEYIFLKKELMKGSFDIFIGGQAYEKGISEIEELVDEIKTMLTQDPDVQVLINDFNLLSGSFGKPVKKGIHGSSQLSKAFKEGNKVINIPTGLEDYKDYIQRVDNYKWIKWQLDGKSFIDITENCPYCISNIKDKKNTIKKVSEVYDPKSIEELNNLVAIFERLEKYFCEKTKGIIREFISNVDGYTEEQARYLLEIKEQIDSLNGKFSDAQNIGFQSLKEVDKVIELLKNYKIDIRLYNHLDSEGTNAKVKLVNDLIDKILTKAGELQGSISRQKSLIERLVQEHRSEINSFLKNAGYKYNVSLEEDEEGKHKLLLSHDDLSDEVIDGKSHLSFGERNAFSLVLFMYDALKKKPDLIVLDDPISSFDKNKKYAIIDMLFRKESGFKGKSVLLLTHDFEPVIDMVYHHTDKFDKPITFLLENSQGVLTEKEIKREDIKLYSEINRENIGKGTNILTKIIYLRRLYEADNDKGIGFQIISNLFHKREVPIIFDGDMERVMTAEELSEGHDVIQKFIGDFNYNSVLKIVKDERTLISLYHSLKSNYEKLQIYRIIFDDRLKEIGGTNIQKFINQTLHIETDYIYQLNPAVYQTVPQFVVEECDSFVNEIDKEQTI
jgi:ABC-type phosphate/phosphonate transport system ATPase subunit